MEDSSLLQSLTLNPSEAALSFPPHRRRPLHSRTYRAVIGILSHCHTNFTQLQDQGDGGDFQLRPVSKKNGSVTFNEVNSEAVLVPDPNSKQHEDTLVKETSIGENQESNFLDGGFDCDQATPPKSGHINLVTNGGKKASPANSISNTDLLVVENQMGDCTIQVDKEQDNGNVVLDNRMDGLGTLEELHVDKDFSVDDYSEVLDSCFGMDMVIEPSKALEDNKENVTALEEIIHEEAEHELQLKEMELEKLIYSSGAVDSYYGLNADEEIEEGEISGEAGVGDASFDALYEDAASLGKRTTEIMHASLDIFNKEESMCSNEDRGWRRHQISDPSVINILSSDCVTMKESRTTAEMRQDYHSQNVFHDSHMETQKTDPIASCSEKLSASGRSLQENAAENQTSAAFEKDADAKRKKRKNGPLTKDKRAKKKKKERIKRAEKNRKLGIKKLKLQQVLKPKTVSYCRHYLHGRCHEGEKCNFSHDTVPLTKSKPCGHFARHSCMKGDSCPYDHQLSKYPCTNYTANGFCSRGSDCLFSHEMPAKQSLSMTPTTSKSELTSVQPTASDKGGLSSKFRKPEVNFSSPLNNSNSSKHTGNHGLCHQKVDAKFSSAGNFYGKSTEPLAARTVPRTPRQASKGISLLSNRKMPLDDTNKHEQGGSTKDVSRKPRGINFLSFARPTSDDSSSTMFSKLLSNSNNEDDTGGAKPTCSLPESCGVLKVNMQMNQNAADGTLSTLLQQRSFSSYDPIINERANFHYKKDDTALSHVKERRSSPGRLQDPTRMPSLSFGRPSDKSTGGQNANLSTSFDISFLSNTPSSVQKAVQSTLAFAANFEPDIRVGSSLHQEEARTSQLGH